MKGLIFLVVNIAVSSAVSLNTNGQKIVDVGEDKDITDANKDSLHDDILEPPKKQRSSTTDVDELWTSPVPYVLDGGLDLNAKGVILRAFEQFRLKSCLDFKPRDSEGYYIDFQKLGGCYSYVGRVIPYGQDLSIGTYCDEISTVEHEILHALGFFHEQTRYDRDDFVTIAFENIQEDRENNFEKQSSETSTTNGVPYDFSSVMHYGKNAFSNGNGSTIVTRDPQFQDVIGQRLEMSPSDVLELNRHYKCNSTIAFKMHCKFSEGNMCRMNSCSQSGSGWEMVTSAYGGPSSDHTNLHSSNHTHHGEDEGYFMHASTASGEEGDSAWLETHRMTPSRECHVQCLQFYFFHNGSSSDQLNIWIREFQDEQDVTGTLRLMGQITGQQTSHWQLKHVSLNATKLFQVEFEVHKGAGSSLGGFSIDDINLSELECPHVTMQVDDFVNVLESSSYRDTLKSTRQYSSGGYAYSVGIGLNGGYVGLYVQLLSGEYDDQLKWPVPQRQVTFQMLDQTPNIQLSMSKQRSITSDLRTNGPNDTYTWGNPRESGSSYVDENNETIFAGPLIGKTFFASLEELQSRNFLKGGSAVFVFNFQDLTPVLKGNALPCPKLAPVEITHPTQQQDQGPCSTRIAPTTLPPPTTTDDKGITPTNLPPPTTTDDKSIFGLSPGLVASPVLALLLALILLIP